MPKDKKEPKEDAPKKDEPAPPKLSKEERAARMVGGPDDIAVQGGTTTIL